MQTFSTASRCFSNKINFLQTIWQLAAAFVIIMVALGQTAKGRCGIRYVTQHIEMDQLGQMFKNLLFAIAVLSAQFWCKKSLQIIVFSKYDFIDDIITDQWKVDFERKAL